MQRKTLTERLTNKYQLIVRNEENFADRWTFSFNFARLLVVLTILVLLFYGMVTGINFAVSYLLGLGGGSEETQQLVTLAAKVDSLEYETNVKDQYILSFKTMLDGGETKRTDTTAQKFEDPVDEKLSKEEEEFRKRFEKDEADPAYNSKDGFTPLYFFAPVSGKTTNIVQGKVIIGLTVTANKTKSIKALDDGVVVLSNRNADSTYKLILQHQTGLITIYDNVKLPLVKTGTSVLRSADIASPAEQNIVFNMLYNGKFLNPRLYIAWEK